MTKIVRLTTLFLWHSKKNSMTSRFILVVAIFLCFSAAVTGPFMLDDFPNILHNPAVLWGELSLSNIVESVASGPSGIINRPLAFVSFGLNYWMFGIDTTSYKIINFVIHIANAMLVFTLMNYLSKLLPENYQRYHFPLWVTLIWAVHPLQVSSVFYVVQRMTLMSGFFMLAAINVFIYATLQSATRKKYLTLLVVALSLMVAGFLCKENAVLVIPLMWLMDRAFRSKGLNTQNNLVAQCFFSFFLYIPAVAIVIYSILSPDWLIADYAKRNFDLSERLMSQAVIVKDYLAWVVWPDISQMGLFHDDFNVIRNISNEFFAALFLHVALLFAGLYFWKRSIIISVAIFFFYINHSLESTVFPLEMVFEHRNYLALLGPVIILILLIAKLVSHFQQNRLRPVIFTAVFLCFALPGSLRAYQWGTPGLWVQMEVANHPESVRARHAFLVQLFHNSIENGVSPRAQQLIDQHLDKAMQLDSNHLASLVMMIKLRSVLSLSQSDQQLQLLYNRLENANANLELHKSHFQDLLQCHLDRHCHFSQQVMQELYRAISQNSNYSNELKADVMATWAVFYGQTYAFNDRVEGILLQANALASTPYVNESLAQYYLLAGSPAKVNQLLNDWPESKGSWIARRRVQEWLKNYTEGNHE